MKLRCLYEAPKVPILLVVMAILFTLGVGSASAAAEPGTVTVVVASEPPTLEPGESPKGHISRVLMNNILEALTELDYDNGTVIPRLATSWKQIDPRTWQFSLRKGVKFHDGEDFNAKTFIWNVNRMYDKKVISNVRDKFFSGLKMEPKALDSHTVEIKVDKVQPLLPTLISFMTICSPNTPVRSPRNPIGTGPYKFVKWDAGVQIVMERFEGWWGKKPPVKKAIYVWRNETSVRAAMVAIGEADLATEISLQDANKPDMDVSYLNSDTTWFRVGGIWDPPLNDIRVRQALNYAVDRKSMIGTILSKDVVAATQMNAPTIFGYNRDLKVWPYDPEKAKKLIEEARKDGVPVDKEIKLVGRLGYFPGCEELGEAMVTMYNAVGLKTKLMMVEPGVYPQYRGKPYPTNGEPYLVQHALDNNVGDPFLMARYNYHSGGRSGSLNDPKVDSLIERAESASGEERKKLWQETFAAIEKSVPHVVLFHMVVYARIGSRINFKPNLGTVNEIPIQKITFK